MNGRIVGFDSYLRCRRRFWASRLRVMLKAAEGLVTSSMRLCRVCTMAMSLSAILGGRDRPWNHSFPTGIKGNDVKNES